MSFSTVLSAAIQGLHVDLVHVEADVSNGLPMFHMVGYLSSEVKEASERVRTAIRNSGIQLPAKKMVVNLAPATVRKKGASFDLPIALAVLASMGIFPDGQLKDTLVVGELSLDGEVNEIRGVLPIVRMAGERGIKRCIVPWENEKEGAWIPNMEVIGVSSLKEVIELLRGRDREEGNGGKRNGDRAGTKEGQKNGNAKERGRTETGAGKGGKRERKKQENHSEYILRAIARQPGKGEGELDFAQVRGQAGAKRAAEIAAAGFHNLLLIGPPGAGKTMIAKRISGILPLLTKEECLEVSSIYSISGLLNRRNSFISTRPFLSPHHTITAQALSGGGAYPRPGVISLAHKGVLFLDELPEYKKSTLEILRQPMEDKEITLVRQSGTYRYPADFMLVAAMNPCKCGYYPDRSRCRCREAEIAGYLGKISKPLLDRMDICVEAPVIRYEELTGAKANESSAEIRNRVMQALERQRFRFREAEISYNSQISSKDMEQYCKLSCSQQIYMKEIYQKLELSARGYYKILKTARTIADLDECADIRDCHLNEAVCYRIQDKKYWE